MTPSKIVGMVLDSVGFEGENCLSKSIMEPSFGDGAFLLEIVSRIILEGKQSELSSDEIARIIKSNVYGVEKDERLHGKAIERLDALLERNGIPPVSWGNLTMGDTLVEYKKHVGTKDFCVGNPPFVRIHNIPDDYREVVQDFQFVSGMIDLYVVFYEIGLSMLRSSGKLGYISPNSFMRNTSQRDFRQHLIDNRYLSAIYDFKTSKLFEDADTYTCICVLDKDGDRENLSVDYKEYKMYDVVARNTFDYDYFAREFSGKAWNLASEEDVRFLDENKELPTKIGDIAIVQNGIATLKDSVYINKVFEDKELTIPYMGRHTDEERVVYFGFENRSIPIESTILHRCVKASRYDGVMGNTYIIFPYKEKSTNGSGYEPMLEGDLRKSFPMAYDYLLRVKGELSSRDMDKNSDWFLFGRSQGLANSRFKKIVFKHIVSKSSPIVTPHVLDEDVIVYSGMYTVVGGENFESKEDYDRVLGVVSSVFASPMFGRYLALVGKDMQGGYKTVSTKMVRSFGISIGTLPTMQEEELLER